MTARISLVERNVAREPPPSAVRADVRGEATDRAWVDRIRAGDMTAFEALFRSYWQRLYAFAYRYVRSQDEAQDVTQEVFFRIWRGRADWVPAGTVASYLYCAVRNAARDRLERAAVARRYHAQVAHVAPAADTAAELEAADLAAAVERALAELPPKRAEVCKLRLIDGLTYAQIADRLGIREKTVETQLARGLKFLRDRMRQALPSPQ